MNIICPVCKNKLTKYEKSYKCNNNHNYDIASCGYVNLNMHKSINTGDNPEMIEARTSFLNKGYYNFLLNEVNKYIDTNDELLDFACGQGYYTSKFKANKKIGIDLSKQGLKVASKADKNTTYILSSIFHSPIESNSVDKIITIFAPIAKSEILRLLKDDGRFILVKPDQRHLYELKQAIYDKPYLNEVEDIDIEGLIIDKHINISNKVTLDNIDLNNLFMMTPYYNTTSLIDKNKLKDINQLEITFCFIIDIYKKI